MTITCPRCGTFVVTKYIDTAGQHWYCPFCGRNSDSYTLVWSNRTLTWDEIDKDVYKKRKCSL